MPRLAALELSARSVADGDVPEVTPQMPPFVRDWLHDLTPVWWILFAAGAVLMAVGIAIRRRRASVGAATAITPVLVAGAGAAISALCAVILATT